MIRAVIFDIDNTMYSYDTGNEVAQLALKAYCQQVLAWSEEYFTSLMEAARSAICSSLTADHAVLHNRLIRFQRMLELAGVPPFPYAKEMYRIYWDTLLAQMAPERGLLDFIKWLNQKQITIGIGTDLTAYIQYRKLECLGVSPYISWMVTSEEAGIEKPAPEFFQLCQQKTGCLAAECLFIGDHFEKDIKGAIKAGMQAGWYQPQCSEACDNEAPYQIITSYRKCNQQFCF